MATVDELFVTPALKIVLADDSAPTPSEKSDALAQLNELIDEIDSEKLMLFQEFQEQFTLTSAISYTIGPGGVFNTTRPEHLVSAYFRETNGTIDYPIRILQSKAEYDRIALKTLGGFPDQLYYDNANPLGTIFVWRQNAGSLFLTSMKQVAEFSALSDVVSFPRGYRAFFKWNLAKRLFPAFNMPVPPDVNEMAAITMGKIRRRNEKNGQALNESAMLSNNLGVYDINRGY